MSLRSNIDKKIDKNSESYTIPQAQMYKAFCYQDKIKTIWLGADSKELNRYLRTSIQALIPRQVLIFYLLTPQYSHKCYESHMLLHSIMQIKA